MKNGESNSQETPKPKAIVFAEKVLAAMVKDMDKNRMWVGRMTTFQLELGVPPPYYSDVIRLLKDSGAAVQIKRGGGHTPSEWQILDPKANIEKASKLSTVTKRWRTIESRLDNLEENVGGVNIKKALADLANDIGDLKGGINAQG